MISRAEVAAVVSELADQEGLPVVVGNGYLLRGLGGTLPQGQVLHLLNGMGLASAVAAGVAENIGRPVIAIEADGNHLMGIASANWTRSICAEVIHIVHWNGGWEGSAGERYVANLPFSDSYRWMAESEGLVFTDATLFARQLRKSIDHAPVLFHVIGGMQEPPRLRGGFVMKESAERFAIWLQQHMAALK